MTKTETRPAPASEKQISFVKSLLEGREVDADRAADIDALLTLPKRPRAKAPNAMQALLASVPKSKYAIPTAELEFTDADDAFRGDLVFVELREYMQTLYMRQLHGAPGAFSRSRLTTTSVKAIIEILARDPYKYTRLFGENYACCGSCGAELTDPRSRELFLGPECRKKFGH